MVASRYVLMLIKIITSWLAMAQTPRISLAQRLHNSTTLNNGSLSFFEMLRLREKSQMLRHLMRSVYIKLVLFLFIAFVFSFHSIFMYLFNYYYDDLPNYCYCYYCYCCYCCYY
jgi:hypothetical protein